MSRELVGSNREIVGSAAYFEKLHNTHFSGTLRCSRSEDFARSMESLAENRFCHLFKPNLEQLIRELERDLEQGLRDNDYIRDENADGLRTALKQLERCGIQCYSLESTVDDLAWFVGGDEDKIHRLQCKLNELKIGGHLTEDGIYGKKTDTVRSALLDELARGTIPALRWIDPLQSNSTGIRTVTKTVRDGRTFSRLVRDGSNTPLFRADLHPYKGNSNYYHVNVDTLPDAPVHQQNLAKRLDHAEISKEAYDVLKDFQTSAKKVRIAGRVLLVAGSVLDVLELCSTIDDDLHDADRKIGKRLTAQRPKSVVVGMAVLLARKAAHGPVLQSALLFFREWELLLAVLPVVWFLELQGLLLDHPLENGWLT